MADPIVETRHLEGCVAPFLEPGEVVHQVIAVQGGVRPSLRQSSPRLGLLAVLVIEVATRFYVIAVTDRSIKIVRRTLGSKRKPPKGKKLVKTLPRQTRLGPAAGRALKIKVGRKTYWVDRGSKNRLFDADAALGRTPTGGPTDAAPAVAIQPPFPNRFPPTSR